MSSAQHFEKMYQDHSDPWRVASDWYERRKRALLLASLPNERYQYGFEPGCGNGETTVLLLERCDRLCAVDFSDKAVQLTGTRIQGEGRNRLDLRSMPLPSCWPDVPASGFDLIVVSELAYYLDDKALAHFNRQCLASLSAGGHLAMCHWQHDAHDRQQPTQLLHRSMDESPHLMPLLTHTETDFQLDIWQKTF